ncbi:MAG: CoA-binding protein [Alphaproteobacteria bacterium]|nr:CoA-binding protein [Alphaproteobacteria bacterium]
MPDPERLEEVRELLQGARTVAVLGASPDPDRPAAYVPAWLHAHGRRILPVNPRCVGQVLHGEPVRATLAELREPVDLVDVFRRPEHLAGHLDDLLAMDPPPGAVWLQQGIRDEAFAARLRAAGLRVVQDRCTMADLMHLGSR